MAARRPFWKWHRWKSIGFCLWPPSTCIWNLKLKFQSKLDLCSGNHVVYRQTDRRTDGQTDRRTDKVNPVYPPSNFVGRGYKYWSCNPVRYCCYTSCMYWFSIPIHCAISWMAATGNDSISCQYHGDGGIRWSNWMGTMNRLFLSFWLLYHIRCRRLWI